MKNILFLSIALSLLFFACSKQPAEKTDGENPFFAAFDTPRGVPPFDKITEEHYVPAFKETSLFDQETAARYREEILSKGGTRPGMELYQNFRGRDPEIGPLLEKRGLN